MWFFGKVQRPVWRGRRRADRYVYVADSGNHALRRIDASGCVITLVGSVPPHREKGTKTALAVQQDSRHREPSGDHLRRYLGRPRCTHYLYSGHGQPQDPQGYRGGITTPTNVQVTCFAGRCGERHERLPGFAAGRRAGTGLRRRVRDLRPLRRASGSRGATPSPGDLIIADTNNHAIRKINATRFVFDHCGSNCEEERGRRLSPSLCSWCPGVSGRELFHSSLRVPEKCGY